METSIRSPEAPAMEQLWYTWAAVGLEGPGFQIHAASPGLREVTGARVRALRRFVGYTLPPSADSLALRPEDAPVSLALVDADGERILVHRAYAGRDGAGRPGNFFTHVVTALPGDFTARRAVRTWGSSFWQRGDAGLRVVGDLGLDRVMEIPLGPLSFDDLRTPRVQEHIAYVIDAFVGLEPSGRLYLAAPPQVVVALIFALTQTLPAGMLRSLTFSTYERDVLEAPARIVGTCLHTPVSEESARPAADLPEACYGGGNAALNWYSGRRTALAAPSSAPRYGEAAATELLHGAGSRADGFVAFAQRLEVADTPTLLAVHRLFVATRSTSLRPADLDEMLSDARRGRAFLSLASVRSATVQAAVSDQEWWQTKGRAAIGQLETPARQPGGEDLLASLGSLAEAAALTAADGFSGGLREDAHYLIENVVALAPPTERQAAMAAFFGEVTRRVGAPREDEYDWSARREILRYAAAGARDIPPDEVRPWLGVEWRDAAELLALGLPDSWVAIAAEELIQRAVREGRYTAGVAEAVRAHVPAFQDALERLIAAGKTSTAETFCSGLFQAGYSDQLPLIVALLRSAHADAPTLERLLERAALDPDDIRRLVDEWADVLLSKLARCDSLTHLVVTYLDSFQVTRLDKADVRNTVATLARGATRGLDARRRQKLNALSEVASFYAGLREGLHGLERVCPALNDLQPQQLELRELLTPSIASRIETADELERVVHVLARPLAGNQWNYLNSLIESQRRGDQPVSPAFLLAVVEFALKLEEEAGLEWRDSTIRRCEAIADKETKKAIRDLEKQAAKRPNDKGAVAGGQRSAYSAQVRRELRTGLAWPEQDAAGGSRGLGRFILFRRIYHLLLRRKRDDADE